MWVEDMDTTLQYSWRGETFENVAHGKGELIIYRDSTILESKKVNAYYGAIDIESKVDLDDGGKFIGQIKDNKMEGFGVLSKANELYVGHFHESKPHGYLKWFKNDSLYYEGTWKNGVFDGEGTLYKEDGSVKSGEWSNGQLIQTLVDVQLATGHYVGYAKNGKPDGAGQMDYAGGASYKGKWKEGKWNGEGLYVCNSDSVFATWADGEVNGDVIYKTGDLFFEGTFVDNIPTGIGSLATSDGTFYAGSWVDGQRGGDGDMIFANGDRYSGEWENNLFNGYGTYHYSQQRASYAGDWKNGLQDGIGRYRSHQFAYQGEWEKGWMDGDGILVFKNGDRYEGTLHENVIDGIGSYMFANGNRYDGEFVNGKMTGLGVFQFKNGNRFEGEFYDGKIYGDGTMYLVNAQDTICITGFWPLDGSFPKQASILFANGDLYEGPMVNGLSSTEGLWISGKERQEIIDKVEGSFSHKANELYKKHRETINWCLMGVSAVVTGVEVAAASTVVLAPVAGIAHGVNVGINVVDAGLAIASASLDVAESNTLGEDNTEALETLGTEVGLNASFILIPKVAKVVTKPLGKAVKNVTRSIAASNAMKATGKLIVKKSALKFVKGKVMGKHHQIKIVIEKKVRRIEAALIRSKYTRNTFIAVGRLLTTIKNQTITYSSYLKKIKDNPALKDQLKLSSEGNSKNLGYNMRLLGHDKFVKRNERIRRYLGYPKRQVEPHHIVPSNPVTEQGRQARKILDKYFGSPDHPCNGIWLPRSNKQYGYKGLAKGSNHSPNTIEYEERVAAAINQTFNKYKKQYAKNPEKMQKVLAETLDNLKEQLYKGTLATGKDKTVHTVLSIFKESQGVVSKAAAPTLNLTSRLAIQTR